MVLAARQVFGLKLSKIEEEYARVEQDLRRRLDR
jgi:hypothetical protein